MHPFIPHEQAINPNPPQMPQSPENLLQNKQIIFPCDTFTQNNHKTHQKLTKIDKYSLQIHKSSKKYPSKPIKLKKDNYFTFYCAFLC